MKFPDGLLGLALLGAVRWAAPFYKSALTVDFDTGTPAVASIRA